MAGKTAKTPAKQPHQFVLRRKATVRTARTEPQKARSYRTPEKDAKFFKILAEGYSVTRAANEAGYYRQRVYEIRKEDSEFEAAWDDAVDQGTDLIEDEMQRRAVKGVEENIYYRGQKCGVAHKYSDVLMIFNLKARRPDKYRDNVDMVHSGGLNIGVLTGVPRVTGGGSGE